MTSTDKSKMNFRKTLMPIDFEELMDEADDAVINPRDIFLSLNKASNFSFPRDIQSEVMKLWFESRDNRDNIIKLNVGSGKTLVGLMLLQSSLNEGKGPALFVTPDKQLTQQVLQEAKLLGLEVTDDPRDPSYEAGEKICVVNVYKLFNGRSVFGAADAGQKIKIGSVVVDDAHACVSTISDQFRIVLPNGHEAYKHILQSIRQDMVDYNEAKFLDVEEGDPRAIMEVPFWTWSAHHSDILKILQRHRNDDDLCFTYPLLKELLPLCRCVIGGQNLEIEPPFPAIDVFSSFRRAKRRIYMTATLSDDSVLATHFGADSEKLGEPLVPTSSQSMGERMILMPQELNSDLTPEDIKGMLSSFSKQHNVVVIVPSVHASSSWEDVADQILVGDGVAAGVAQLKNAHVGLTVLVNRYDGIDLPASACRILAISGLPEVTSYSELIDESVLSDSSLDLRRQIERIEQGMGRGVRSNDDYCAVLLLGPKLTGRVRSHEGERLLTPATRAQLGLSRKIARKLKKPSISQIHDVILQCLNRDAGWVKVSKKVLIGIDADDSLNFDSAKIALSKAFSAARSNQLQDAVKIISDAVNEIEDEQEQAWLLTKKAAIEHNIDASSAQKTLTKAHSLERGVMKPLVGSKYKKLTPATGQQAANVIKFHEERFIDAVEMKLFANALCSDLQFEGVSADRFEAAVNDLARFIGLNGHRPEKEFNEGPDNLWALPEGRFLVIECKNGVTSDDGISKHDAGQLGQSVEWFKSKYQSEHLIPLMFHPQTFLRKAASPVQGMMVIDEKGLNKLRKSIQGFASEIANADISKSVSEVAKRLGQYSLTSNAFSNAFGCEVKKSK
ncbi:MULTISPECIES: DEAD/DEAH box helicase family protein [unclassified Phaeobacter]|uniref:DEAD/DEAH box helicase family protein n=1 Tax=unclassified Phaeobacter TaxID=2621772 RepID=UPI003A83CD51